VTESLPATAFIRVSRATFDPSRFVEVKAINKKTSQCLIPAISRLPGLVRFSGTNGMSSSASAD
jgi:hypothetical protein